SPARTIAARESRGWRRGSRRPESLCMPRLSSALLLFRWREARLEVLLVHMGGPFWRRRDAGAWSLPKGEHEPDEDSLLASGRGPRDGPRARARLARLTALVRAGCARDGRLRRG